MDHDPRRAVMQVVRAERDFMAVVLVVEDDAFICELTELTVQDWGHQTFAANDVDEALSILRSPLHIDLLFTDIYLKMAIVGGFDLAREGIKLRPQLRVLYTTGNYITDAMKALFLDDAECIRKPYTPHQLQTSFEHLLAAHS
jgi:DNA-binding NtrC family response regulator